MDIGKKRGRTETKKSKEKGDDNKGKPLYWFQTPQSSGRVLLPRCFLERFQAPADEEYNPEYLPPGAKVRSTHFPEFEPYMTKGEYTNYLEENGWDIFGKKEWAEDEDEEGDSKDEEGDTEDQTRSIKMRKESNEEHQDEEGRN
ncbi:hypothetical protein ACLB2K_043464 [Fragaria x ananassa]